GLAYQYFEAPAGNLDALAKLTPTKTGTVEAFDLKPRRRDDGFGFHFSGLVEVPATGIYTYYLRCSPRGRLSIGGQEVVESQGSKRERSGKVAIERGWHPIDLLIYFGSDVDKTLRIDVEGPGLPRQEVAATMLAHDAKATD